MIVFIFLFPPFIHMCSLCPAYVQLMSSLCPTYVQLMSEGDISLL